MSQKLLSNLLNNYFPIDISENKYKEKMILYLQNEPNCFERSLLKGHFTGSAFVINRTKTKTILVNHAKLNRWLQPGGHCDGDTNVANVALKEVMEETGLKKLEIVENEIFDIDIHSIPQRKNVPEHLHLDVRFLIYADEDEIITGSDESTDVKWFAIEEVEQFNCEWSIMRMVDKLKLG
jgi:8-oxo-dGTP pyrophosphatase MutT (NUDIX family)